MNSSFQFILLLPLLLLSQISSSQIDVLANKSFQFQKVGENITLAYISNNDISSDDPDIKHVIIVVHGTYRNADDYYDNMRAALTKGQEQNNGSIIS